MAHIQRALAGRNPSARIADIGIDPGGSFLNDPTHRIGALQVASIAIDGSNTAALDISLSPNGFVFLRNALKQRGGLVPAGMPVMIGPEGIGHLINALKSAELRISRGRG